MIKIQRSFSPDKKLLQRVGNQVLVFGKDNVATADEKEKPITEETARVALKFPSFYSVSGLDESDKTPDKPAAPEVVETEIPETVSESADVPESFKEENRPAKRGKKRK